MNGKGILAATMLGKVEITLQITERALYGHDKSFANSGSDSCAAPTCHKRWQAKSNGAFRLGMGPVHKWDCRTCKSNELNRRGKAISSGKCPPL